MSKSNSYETLEHCRIKDISSFHTVISVNNIAWGIVVPISNINIYIGSDSTLYVCVCVCVYCIEYWHWQHSVFYLSIGPWPNPCQIWVFLWDLPCSMVQFQTVKTFLHLEEIFVRDDKPSIWSYTALWSWGQNWNALYNTDRYPEVWFGSAINYLTGRSADT